jgi:hypothetical protein
MYYLAFQQYLLRKTVCLTLLKFFYRVFCEFYTVSAHNLASKGAYITGTVRHGRLYAGSYAGGTCCACDRVCRNPRRRRADGSRGAPPRVRTRDTSLDADSRSPGRTRGRSPGGGPDCNAKVALGFGSNTLKRYSPANVFRSKDCLSSALRIRDVNPGSRIPDPNFSPKTASKNLGI